MRSHPSGQTFRKIAAVLVIFGFAAAMLLAPGSSASPTVTRSLNKSGKRLNEFVPGEVLVRYKSEKTAEKQLAVKSVRTSAGRDVPLQVERFKGSEIVPGLRIARVPTDQTLEAIAALNHQPDVLYAEPNYLLYADITTPNDPSFNQLYGLTKIGAPVAWDSATGDAAIVIGVIDQGIDFSHQDLSGNKFINPMPGSISGFSGDVNGYNFVDGNGTVFSGSASEDHASHVAGIAGAVGDNNIGVVGVNWTVRLMSLKFLDSTSGSGDTADAISACNYALQMKQLYESSGHTRGANIRVLNNSYGGGGFDHSFQDAINELNSAGILFVAAAGNVEQDSPEPNNDIESHYPSSYSAPNIIAVANTTSTDSLSTGSHYGANSVHLGAPGTAIISTVPGNNYASFSGTSMATPHVAGAAALLLAENPALTVAQLKNLLLLNGDVLPALVDKTITGRRLNVGKSMQALLEADTTAPGAVTNLHVNSINGRTVNVGWNASGDDGAAGTAALYELTFIDFETGQVLPLKTVVPAASGAGQTADVLVPIGHHHGTINVRSLDNVGNEASAGVNVNLTINVANPYATTLSIPVALSTGGTLLPTLQDDDRLLENYPLPFSFPFFGTTFTTINAISTNGNLYFSAPPHRTDPTEADDVPSSTVELTKHKMISGLWDDIDLRVSQRADGGVYVVQPGPGRIIFRWQGEPCNFTVPQNQPPFCAGGPPIDFEIELRSDGTIKSRYGTGGTSSNSSVFPVVGISGGAPDAYVIPTHTSEQSPISLSGAVEVTYIPRDVINPLDQNYFFVSQQYRDLLGREADLGGLAFWANELNPCGTDQICLVNRRTGVTAAFFVENEFQRTGSFVYRSFKGGLGRRPTYSEFSADRPLIVEGPNLEQTKQAYGLLFVQRPEFVAKYSGKNTANDFADALIASIQLNSAIDLTAQKANIVAAYNNGVGQSQQRAFALRAAIDSAPFTDGEYNSAFVLMQYFGYLRRDPDLGGYNFWLGLLNTSQQGNFRGMVCSFITSTEYQERFSTLVPHSNVDCGNLTNPKL